MAMVCPAEIKKSKDIYLSTQLVGHFISWQGLLSAVHEISPLSKLESIPGEAHAI